ncbi:MAG: flagellar basal-body rod protein FlgG [Fimbriimonadaceae bacterium]
MMRALNTAGTGMVAQQYNMDVIANNLSNVNTTSFKAQRAEFQDLMYQTFRASGATTGANANLPQAAQIGLGARFSASVPNFTPGPLQNTGNPLDMAVIGAGFFAVETPDGIAYTRDGGFKVDSEGNMVTSDGYRLIPNITVPEGTTALTVAPSGAVQGIRAGENEVSTLGEITLTMFPNPAGLTRVGQNLYRDSGLGSGAPTQVIPGSEGSGLLRSEFVEGSNVQVVEEMVRMITAQRAYEINSKSIQASDDMLSILNSLKR